MVSGLLAIISSDFFKLVVFEAVLLLAASFEEALLLVTFEELSLPLSLDETSVFDDTVEEKFFSSLLVCDEESVSFELVFGSILTELSETDEKLSPPSSAAEQAEQETNNDSAVRAIMIC